MRCAHGLCNSDSRYKHKDYMKNVEFIPFVKPEHNLKRCQRWVNACGRRHFTVENITKNTYICTKHFNGGRGPTKENPDPISIIQEQRKMKIKIRTSPVRNRKQLKEENVESINAQISMSEPDSTADMKLADKKAIPKSQDPTCLGQNCSRLKHFNTMLKEPNNFKPNGLKEILNKDEVSTQHKQNMECKVDLNKKYLLLKDEDTIYIKEENIEYDNYDRQLVKDESSLSCLQDDGSNSIQYHENVGSYEFVDMNKFTEKDSNLSDGEESKQSTSKEGQLKCNYCDKTFTYRSRLENHSRIHTGVRPYKCETCQKTFTMLNNLNTHTLTHTGQKSHECNVCFKTFAHKNTLTVHKRSHSNVRPHQCGVCNKAFTQTGDLTRHMRSHTGEKPYQCHICQFKCTQAAHLRRHIQTHTSSNLS